MDKKKLLILGLLLLAAASLFAGTTETMPWDNGLKTIQDALTGGTALAIGTIMIIGAGLAIAFTEGQAIKKLLWVVVGVGVAIQAARFAALILPASGFIF